MRLPFQSKPKSVVDRAEATVGEAVEFARSVPERLEGARGRAIAAAVGVAGVAAGVAFWRSRSNQEPSVHHDPTRPPTPWKAQPPTQRPPERGEKPVTDASTSDAVGARSK